MPASEWIESRVRGSRKSPMGALIDAAYATEYGADTSDLSALNIVDLLGDAEQTEARNALEIHGTSDERYHIRGGNQQLSARIAKHLRNPVQVGRRLALIARQADGTYALGFGDGPPVIADLVVLAIPFAVLRNLDIAGAGFDALKMKAIQELGRGQNGKLQLQFASRYWRDKGAWPGRANGESYTDEVQSTWEATRRQAGTSGILNNYTGGSATLAKQTKTPFATAADPALKADANDFLQGLENVFPGGTAKWSGRAASSLPALDPNYGASYSYWRVGQYSTIRGYERVRQGNVFFAGEHCSVDYQGYVQGGAAEGASAAQEILTHLSGREASK
jgi:monoamine oxidase